MRILLTGANGFVGSRLVQALLEEGHHLVCAVRHPPTSGHPRVSYVQADFARDTDKRAWAERLAGIDAVINCAGIFRETGRQTFERVHTAAPCALFSACVEADVHLVIQLSALGADAGAATPFHLSKRAADDYLAGLPIASYIVQPSLIYGPEGRSARAFKILATLPFTVRFGRAEQHVQPVHVDDVVAVMVALTRRPVLGDTAARPQPRSFARLIPVVGPEALPFTSYLRELRAALGLGGFRTVTLPGWLAHAAAAVGGLFPGSLLNRDALAMLERDNTADPALTTALLGHPPSAVGQFVTNAPAERARAQLDWLLPLLRWAIAFVWIATAIVSAFVYPAPDSYELLARSGIPQGLRPLMLYGAAGLDLALGLGILLLRRRRWLWLAQVLLIGFYTAVIALRLPEFLAHPYGPLIKNIPLLAAIWLLYQTEDR